MAERATALIAQQNAKNTADGTVAALESLKPAGANDDTQVSVEAETIDSLIAQVQALGVRNEVDD
jgi:hypothetical protein